MREAKESGDQSRSFREQDLKLESNVTAGETARGRAFFVCEKKAAHVGND